MYPSPFTFRGLCAQTGAARPMINIRATRVFIAHLHGLLGWAVVVGNAPSLASPSVSFGQTERVALVTMAVAHRWRQAENRGDCRTRCERRRSALPSSAPGVFGTRVPQPIPEEPGYRFRSHHAASGSFERFDQRRRF